MKKFAPLFSMIVLAVFSNLSAQDFNVATSTIHDENIFDIHTPSSDQITQLELNISHDWDFDQSSLSLNYTGSLLLFRDLTSRTYHLHTLSLGSMFHFFNEEEEGDVSEKSDTSEDDSTGDVLHTGSDSAGAGLSANHNVVAHSDSSDRFLYIRATGVSQFDKREFSEFDNSLVAGEFILRQPIGLLVSLRPSYRFGYHTFPNLTGISNIENLFWLTLGTSAVMNGWITFSPSLGIKKYVSSNFTYTYTVGGANQSGHGKGGAGGGQRTRTIVLNTPSVRQFSGTIAWQQRLSAVTVLTAAYTYLDVPSSAARLLPEQVSGVLEQHGIGGGINTQTEIFNTQNDIFDDHYGYSGNQFVASAQQSFPFDIVVSASASFDHKKYTLTALDFDSTASVSGNRLDDRVEGALNLSRIFPLADSKSIKPQIELKYIRNNSNAPYYDFDKVTFLIGLEFNF